MKYFKYVLISLVVVFTAFTLASCGSKVDFDKAFDVFTGTIDNEDTVRSSFTVPSMASSDKIDVKWQVVSGNEYAFIGNNNTTDHLQTISIILPDKPQDPNAALKTFTLKVTLTYDKKSKSEEFKYNLAYFEGVRHVVTLTDFYTNFNTYGENDVFTFDSLKVVKVLGRSTILADKTGHAVTLYNNTNAFKEGVVGKLTNVIKAKYHGAYQLSTDAKDAATFIPSDATLDFMPEFTTVKALSYSNLSDGSLITNNPALNTVKYVYAKLSLKQETKDGKTTYSDISITDPKDSKVALSVSKYDSIERYKDLNNKMVKINVYPITIGQSNLAVYLGKAVEGNQPEDMQAKADFYNSLADLNPDQVTKSGQVERFAKDGVEFTYTYAPSATDDEKAALNLDTFNATVTPKKLILVPVVVTAKKGDLMHQFVVVYKVGELDPINLSKALDASNDGKIIKVQGYYTGFGYNKIFVKDLTTAQTVAISYDNKKIAALKDKLGQKVVLTGTITVAERSIQLQGDLDFDANTKLTEEQILNTAKDYSKDYYSQDHLNELINLEGFTYSYDKKKRAETFTKGELVINGYHALPKGTKVENGTVINVKYLRISQHSGDLQVINGSQTKVVQ